MINLNKVFEITDRMRALNNQKEFLNCQLCAIRHEKGGNCHAHKFIGLIYKLNEEEYKKLCRERYEVYEVISTVPDERTRTFLEYRFVYLMTYEDIAELTNYSLRQVMRIIKEGVKNVDNMSSVC